MSPSELDAAIAALGRPQFRWAGARAISESTVAISAWERAHPEKAAEYARLAAARDELDRRVTAERLSRMNRREGRRGMTAAAASEPSETAPMAFAREWLDSDVRWCVMLGATGVGKSVAAEWCVRQYREDGSDAESVTASAVTSWSLYDAARWERLRRVPLLVVDDIGAGASTDLGKGMLLDVLDTRHDAGRRTVLVSNLDPAGLKVWLGARTTDRVQQSRMARAFSGPSLRGGA